MTSSKSKPNKPSQSRPRGEAGRKSAPQRFSSLWPWGIFVPIVAAAIAYGDAARGPFLFDDVPTVVDNTAIKKGDFLDAAFGPVHSPISNRPVACLSFVVSHTIGGLNPTGYHVASVLLHLLNVALLAAVIRRTLRAPNLTGIFDEFEAGAIAITAATLWAVHPLASEAVVYITQRTTLLMSTCLLVLLYALLRARQSRKPLVWDVVAVVATVVGMMCKEEFAAAPILAVLFERAFLKDGWLPMLQRVGTYSILATTWLVLTLCVAMGPSNPTVGYSTVPEVTAWQWLMTQAGVLVHYLRLTVWPQPLRAAYDWDVVREFKNAQLPGLMITGLLAGTVWLFLRRPWWGWLGAMFFLLLAPTSSILPIISEIAAERRMYLPMTALLIPAVIACYLLIRRVLKSQPSVAVATLAMSIMIGSGVILAAMAATRARTNVYADDATFWRDAYEKNELTNGSFMSGLILNAYGKVLAERGQPLDAYELFRRARECESPTIDVHANYAASLVDLGRYAEAEPIYRDVLKEKPGHSDALSNLAKLLFDVCQRDPNRRSDGQDPRLIEAEELVNRALQLRPDHPGFLNTQGMVLYGRLRFAEAEAAFRKSMRLDPQSFQAANNLGVILLEQGRGLETIQLWQPYLTRLPTDVGVRISLGKAYARLGDRLAAQQMYRAALEINPNHAEARALLMELQVAPQ